MAVKIRDTDWADEDEDQWNIVQLRLSDAKRYWPRRYRSYVSGEIDDAKISLDGSTQFVRILLNQAFPEQTIEIHKELVAKFGLLSPKVAVRISDSWWRIDRMTVNHPDPSIALQWNIAIINGFVFLLLGLFVPRMLSVWLGWK